jgi:hypothetical protein
MRYKLFLIPTKMKSNSNEDKSETSNDWFQTDTGLQTNAVLRANRKAIQENLEEYTTEGKTYQTLCREAEGFSELNRSVQMLNKSINQCNVKRKVALEKARTPSSKLQPVDRLVKQLSQLDPAARKALMEKVNNLPEGK